MHSGGIYFSVLRKTLTRRRYNFYFTLFRLCHMKKKSSFRQFIFWYAVPPPSVVRSGPVVDPSSVYTYFAWRYTYLMGVSWVSAGMGKRGHSPLWKCCLSVCRALVLTAKRSVDELFIHYFYNLSSAFGALPPIPQPALYPWTPVENFRLQTINLPTPGKNPAGAHGRYLNETGPNVHHATEHAINQSIKKFLRWLK